MEIIEIFDPIKRKHKNYITGLNSSVWIINFYDYGTFELRFNCIVSIEPFDIVNQANLFGIVMNIKIENNCSIISGYDLKGIMSFRESYYANGATWAGNVDSICRTWFNDSTTNDPERNAINGFVFHNENNPPNSKTIPYKIDNDSHKYSEILKNQGIQVACGYDVQFKYDSSVNGNGYVFTITQGRDRKNYILSQELNNLYNVVYEYNLLNACTHIMSTDFKYYGDDTISPIKRIVKTINQSADQYTEAQNILAEKKPTETLCAEIPEYYTTNNDIILGDYVTVVYNGIEMHPQITQQIHDFSPKGYKTIYKFGQEKINPLKKILKGI